MSKQYSITVGTDGGQLTLNFTDVDAISTAIAGILKSSDTQDVTIYIRNEEEEAEEEEAKEDARWIIFFNSDGGDRIRAIKAVREVTGLGLAEAKNLVERQPGVPEVLIDRASTAQVDDVINLWTKYYPSGGPIAEWEGAISHYGGIPLLKVIKCL